MNTRLDETAILLREIRSRMHSVVDASIIEALDKAIELVESENTEQSRKAALQMIGNLLRLIPALKTLYEELTK